MMTLTFLTDLIKEEGNIMETNKNNCIICKAELEYYETPRKMKCVICHHEFETNVACKNGHFICDNCHSMEGDELIMETCLHTDSHDPIEIMQLVMKQPQIHMHGPEHHVLVGSALLAAYKNSGGNIDLPASLVEMARRGKQVPGGACGFWGCCGAAVSAGMFVSIITGSTPLRNKEWKLSNLMTSRALEAIGELGGPRCCKRDSFVAAESAAAFVEENFGIKMEMPKKIICEFVALNNVCIHNRCPYYNEK